MHKTLFTNTYMNAMCAVLCRAMPSRAMYVCHTLDSMHSFVYTFSFSFRNFGWSFFFRFFFSFVWLCFFNRALFFHRFRQSWRSSKEFVRIKINIVHTRYYSYSPSRILFHSPCVRCLHVYCAFTFAFAFVFVCCVLLFLIFPDLYFSVCSLSKRGLRSTYF